MDRVYELFPDYARDLKINLQNVLKQPELTEQQTWGTAVLRRWRRGIRI